MKKKKNKLGGGKGFMLEEPGRFLGGEGFIHCFSFVLVGLPHRSLLELQT